MAESFSISEIVIQRLIMTDTPRLNGLLEVYREAFGMAEFIPPPAAYLANLLQDRTVVVLTADLHDRVIGGLTAYILPSLYYPASEAYLYDLAVGTPWQRQGVGTALLAALKEHCAHISIKEIFVQADRPDK